jgi:hypothetical protein
MQEFLYSVTFKYTITRLQSPATIRSGVLMRVIVNCCGQKSFYHAAFSTKTPFTKGLFSMTGFRSSNSLSRPIVSLLSDTI